MVSLADHCSMDGAVLQLQRPEIADAEMPKLPLILLGVPDKCKVEVEAETL